MIPQPRSGIALIIVISLIGLMAITLGYLNHSCRIMLLQTDRVYLKAVEWNLNASGLEWARNQRSEDRSQKTEGKEGPVVLDANDVGGSQARLSVRIEDVNDPNALVYVQTYVSSARQEFSRSRTFSIPRP
jgi:hypothetical protein